MGRPDERAAAAPAPSLSISFDAEAEAAGDAWAAQPPSARVGWRVGGTVTEPLSPRRALAGAGVAVAGVSLGISAVLLLTSNPQERPETTGGPPSKSVPGVGAAPTVEASPPLPPPRLPPPPPRPEASAPAPQLPALTVLNNSRRAGLADRAATAFRGDGWAIRQVGNFTGRIRATTVYYAPGQRREAQQLADHYGLTRVLPRFAGLPGSGLTVVLTRDSSLPP